VTALTVAACGGDDSSEEGGGGGVIVNVNTGGSATFTRNFNPYSPNVQTGAAGTIYEPLFFYNLASNDEPMPLLGTDFEYSEDGRTLTITTREGVQWSDGEPFTAADVAFTFNSLMDPAFNRTNIPLTSAEAIDDNTVVLTFSRPAFRDEWNILGQQMILPEHIWSEVEDPANFLNENPVGTGPFILTEFSQQTFLLEANPNYWEEGVPAIDGLRFTAYSGNTAANQALVAGQIDWGNTFIPDPENSWINIDPETHHVPTISVYITDFVPNLEQWPTSDLAVRQAISLGIDREEIIENVYYGTARATNPEQLLTPRDDALIDTEFEYDPEAAREVLEDAGYTEGSDGIYVDPQGRRLSVTVKVVTGYTDYIQALQTMQQDLAEVGIELEVEQVSFQQFSADRQTGNFELLIDGQGGTPTPYHLYDRLLNSANTAPIGENAASNWARYSNPEVDALLNSIAETNDQELIDDAVDQLSQIFVEELPYIGLWQNPPNVTFLSERVTGWPTDDNPYALPMGWAVPDLGIVARSLQPVE